jgi:hypothetical protein
MKYHSYINQAFDCPWDALVRKLMSTIGKPGNTGKRNVKDGAWHIGFRSQEPVAQVALNRDCRPPEYSGPFYSILKRSIVGGP